MSLRLICRGCGGTNQFRSFEGSSRVLRATPFLRSYRLGVAAVGYESRTAGGSFQSLDRRCFRHIPHTLASLLLPVSRIALIEQSIGNLGLMSSVDFRWLSEPVVLKDTEPACQDQARIQPKPGPSAQPSAPRLAPLQRPSFYPYSSFVIRHSSLRMFRPCLVAQGPVSVSPGKSW